MNDRYPPTRLPTSSRFIRHRRRADRRAAAVVAVEVRRLARQLRGTGPLPRTTLARLVDARHWREGGFETALGEGIRQGAIRELPFGFVAAADSAQADRNSE